MHWSSEHWETFFKALSAVVAVVVATMIYFANERRAVEREIKEVNTVMEERFHKKIHEIQKQMQETQKRLHDTELLITAQGKDIEHLKKSQPD